MIKFPRRRTGWTVLACALALLVTMAISGCGGDDDDEEQAQTATQPQAAEDVTEYVGTLRGVDPKAEARSGDYFVAVAVSEDGAVEAYICDGTGNSQILEGTAEDDQINLESKTGEAILTGEVTDAGIDGEIELEGETLAFTTSEARGRGGLYTVSLDPAAGEVAARSERGNEIEATYSPESPDFEAEITTVDGESLPLDGRARSRGEIFDEYRVILLDSGDARGNKTAKATSTGETGWSWPLVL